jgi:hypothetical protein
MCSGVAIECQAEDSWTFLVPESSCCFAGALARALYCRKLAVVLRYVLKENHWY